MDWKGAALVLQQLGELRKPSQLEVAEKQYELEAKETEAKRRHELALASLEGIQNNIKSLDELLVEKAKAGNSIATGLSSIAKKENISGNAASLNEQLYGKEFADYEGIRKNLNAEYNSKLDELNQQLVINKFGNLGREFNKEFKLGNVDYFADAQYKRNPDGTLKTSFIKSEERIVPLDKSPYIRTSDGAARKATKEEANDPTITKFIQQIQKDTLDKQMSYDETLYAISKAKQDIINSYEDKEEGEIAANAFEIGAKSTIDRGKLYEEEETSKASIEKELDEEEDLTIYLPGTTPAKLTDSEKKTINRGLRLKDKVESDEHKNLLATPDFIVTISKLLNPVVGAPDEVSAAKLIDEAKYLDAKGKPIEPDLVIKLKQALRDEYIYNKAKMLSKDIGLGYAFGALEEDEIKDSGAALGFDESVGGLDYGLYERINDKYKTTESTTEKDNVARDLQAFHILFDEYNNVKYDTTEEGLQNKYKWIEYLRQLKTKYAPKIDASTSISSQPVR